jgi:tellurite resistance protein TerC
MIGSPTLWVAFNLFVLGMLALDLGVFHRRSHEIRPKEALVWSAVWIALSFAFNTLLYLWFGKETALQFTSGYLIEKSLSIDNVFVFLVVFSQFKISARFQHKVLFWGILSALAMRAAFIFAGFELLEKFHWIIYVFAAFLIFAGFKMIFNEGAPLDLEKSRSLRFIRRIFPLVDTEADGSFFLVRDRQRFGTRLLLALIAIEAMDIIFAMDSIPAVLAITSDPFIVYTSNIFALLGLRSLYFALSHLENRFRYLRYGLAAILVLVGLKMCLKDIYVLPTWAALCMVLGALLVSILASVYIPVRSQEKRERGSDGV